MRKMARVFGFCSIFILITLCFSSNAKAQDDIAKKLDAVCPLKGVFSVIVQKDHTILPDKNYNGKQGGDVRFCLLQENLEYCQKNNPTKTIPCRLLSPAIGKNEIEQFCPLTVDQTFKKEKIHELLGLWETQKITTEIHTRVYSCRVPYAVDSCRYLKQASGLTVLQNGDVFYDKNILIDYDLCNEDPYSIAEFNSRFEKQRPFLSGMLSIMNTIWQSKCPQNNSVCKQKVKSIWNKAALEATAKLGTYQFDDDVTKIVKFIKSKYETQADDSIAGKYDPIDKPLSGDCLKSATAFRSAGSVVYGEGVSNRVISAWCEQIQTALFGLQGQFKAGLNYPDAVNFLKLLIRNDLIEQEIAIENAYRTVFGREPSLVEIKYWQNAIKTEGKWWYATMVTANRDYAISNVEERKSLINLAYLASFGRMPTQTEVSYWASRTEYFSLIADANKNWLYSNKPEVELIPMVKRAYQEKKGRQPVIAELNIAAVTAGLSKFTYQELLNWVK